jgi:hypothetical protein
LRWLAASLLASVLSMHRSGIALPIKLDKECQVIPPSQPQASPALIEALVVSSRESTTTSVEQPVRDMLAAGDRGGGRPLRVYDTHDLFAGSHEVAIDHNGARYRLKITRQGKLILNK